MYLAVNSLYVLRVNNDRSVTAYCCPNVLVLTFIYTGPLKASDYEMFLQYSPLPAGITCTFTGV